VTTGKQAFHVDRDESENKTEYLVLNYDMFSLDDSPNLILKLGKQKIDFVILDEIHFVKIRGSSKGEREWNRTESKRHKHLVGLMTEIREKNEDVKVLGMTATPVINDLMEGRSLIDLVTGGRYNDVFVNPTIPNASTLYEKFQLMSVREMPDYKINVNLNDDIEVDAHTDDSIRSLIMNNHTWNKY
jgi:hypothetical protein